jgi:hypothetical protein
LRGGDASSHAADANLINPSHGSLSTSRMWLVFSGMSDSRCSPVRDERLANWAEGFDLTFHCLIRSVASLSAGNTQRAHRGTAVRHAAERCARVVHPSTARVDSSLRARLDPLHPRAGQRQALQDSARGARLHAQRDLPGRPHAPVLYAPRVHPPEHAAAAPRLRRHGRRPRRRAAAARAFIQPLWTELRAGQSLACEASLVGATPLQQHGAVWHRGGVCGAHHATLTEASSVVPVWAQPYRGETIDNTLHPSTRGACGWRPKLDTAGGLLPSTPRTRCLPHCRGWAGQRLSAQVRSDAVPQLANDTVHPFRFHTVGIKQCPPDETTVATQQIFPPDNSLDAFMYPGVYQDTLPAAEAWRLLVHAGGV